MKKIDLSSFLFILLILTSCSKTDSVTSDKKIDNEITNSANTNTASTNAKNTDFDKITKRIMQSNESPLSDNDFVVKYKSIDIAKDTNYITLFNKLGKPDGFEDNNYGFINGNEEYRRWNLCYPNYDNPQVRMIMLSKREYNGDEVKDGETYIVGVYLEQYKTIKGLQVGDNLEKLLKLYGKPETINNRQGMKILRYTKNSLHFEVTLDDAMEKVQYIFLDYNMEKSVKEQESADYKE